MNHNITHNNHYIPQMLLKNWSADGKTIYEYDLLVPHKNVPEWQEKSIINIACLRDFYTRYMDEQEIDDIEKLFRNFENNAKPAFDKIIAGMHMTYLDWYAIADFVAAQSIRTPARMLEILKKGQKTLPDLFQNALDTAAKNINAGIIQKSEVIPFKNSELIPIRTSYDQNTSLLKVESIIGKGYYLFAIKHLLSEVYLRLRSHKWHVIHASDDITFPLTDDPVICLNYYNSENYNFQGGWDRKNCEIIMPISPDICLYTLIKNKNAMTHLDKNIEFCNLLQKLMLKHAHRYIYLMKPLDIVSKIRPRIIDLQQFSNERSTLQNWHQPDLLWSDKNEAISHTISE